MPSCGKEVLQQQKVYMANLNSVESEWPQKLAGSCYFNLTAFKLQLHYSGNKKKGRQDCNVWKERKELKPSLWFFTPEV